MPVNKSVARRKTRTSIKSTKSEDVVMPKLTETYSFKTKLRQPKVFTGLIVVAVIIIAFLLKGLFVAALVNGEPITRVQIISELEKQGGKQALSSLVNQALILQEARKKNVQASQEEINAAVKQIEDSLKSQGQDLNTALSMQGMTRKDLEMQLKLRTLVEKLLADKIKVTDKEVADYIEKNKETLPTDTPEAEIKKNVGEQLKQQKLSTESSAWIEGLNKNAKINYFVTY
jgi:parvulin-like peptidyl-prolyl isomerase